MLHFSFGFCPEVIEHPATVTGRILDSGATPTTPSSTLSLAPSSIASLLIRAAAMPATFVPCPRLGLSELGDESDEYGKKLNPSKSSAKVFPSSSRLPSLFASPNGSLSFRQ